MKVAIRKPSNYKRAFNWLKSKDVFNIGVISSAAPDLRRYNHRELRQAQQSGWYWHKAEDAIRAQIKAAIIAGHDSIVLGAFGCGAFQGDPEVVAQVYRNVLVTEDLSKYFKKVHFAVLVARESDEQNFIAFSSHFSSAK